MSRVTVTAVIPNWNGRRYLEVLLKQIPAQTYPVSEVLVVDNGSTDGSAEFAESLGRRVIRFESNRGFAAAVNRGVREAQSDLVAILNNDVELPEEYLERLMNAFQAEYAFVTGCIRMAAQPDRIDATFDLAAGSGCAWRCGHGSLNEGVWRQARSIHLAPMTALLIRRRHFLQAGGLDERFGSYLEDVDFGLACASKGYKGRYVPEAVAYHIGSGTRGAWHAETVRQISRNQVLLVAKWQGSRGWVKNGWRIAVGQGLWGMLAAKQGRALAWFHGKIDGLRLLRSYPSERNPEVSDLLNRMEAEIAELQRSVGWQPYWRWYFRLVGKPGSK